MRWLVLLVLAGCAHDVFVRWPGSPALPEAGATLELRFTNTVSQAQVAINGRLVASGERTDLIVVTGLPAGQTTVVVAADGMPVEKAFSIELQAGQRTVVPLIAPPAQPFFGLIAQAIISAAVYLGYQAIHDTL